MHNFIKKYKNWLKKRTKSSNWKFL